MSKDMRDSPRADLGFAAYLFLCSIWLVDVFLLWPTSGFRCFFSYHQASNFQHWHTAPPKDAEETSPVQKIGKLQQLLKLSAMFNNCPYIPISFNMYIYIYVYILCIFELNIDGIENRVSQIHWSSCSVMFPMEALQFWVFSASLFLDIRLIKQCHKPPIWEWLGMVGNGLYHLLMVIWGMVYGITMKNHHVQWEN